MLPVPTRSDSSALDDLRDHPGGHRQAPVPCDHWQVIPDQDSRATSLSLSVSVIDADTGVVLVSLDADRIRPTASIGKVLLLIEVARRLVNGDLDSSVAIPRSTADTVADSGLWQHLSVPALPAPDLAALVGAVSDNLATNVLLRTVGLPSVTALAVQLDLAATRLHDQVRDVRGPTDPATLSTGSAIGAGRSAGSAAPRCGVQRRGQHHGARLAEPGHRHVHGRRCFRVGSAGPPRTGSGLVGGAQNRAPTPGSAPTSASSAALVGRSATPCWSNSMTAAGTSAGGDAGLGTRIQRSGRLTAIGDGFRCRRRQPFGPDRRGAPPAVPRSRPAWVRAT